MAKILKIFVIFITYQDFNLKKKKLNAVDSLQNVNRILRF